jgi:hypothetical protein
VITLSWLFLILVVAAALSIIDGIIRVRGRGNSILAIIEIIIGVLLILSYFVAIPFGTVALSVALLVVLVLQLVFRGSTYRSGVTITVVALVLTAIYLVLALGWIHIPGIN